MNLIGNALKHAGRPDPKVTVTVADAGPGRLEFAVADNGQGIDPQYHEKIFVIFQTLAARDKVEGAGVGLCWSRRSSRVRAGACASSRNRGRGRRSDLPGRAKSSCRRRCPAPPRRPHRPRPRHSPRRPHACKGELTTVESRPLNMLLVEDDELDVMNVQRAFKKNNISNPLFIASNGIEALAMLRGEAGVTAVPPIRRIILLDLNMPRMGGIEFLRELRADPELAPTTVIVLTTSDEDRDKVEAYKLNVAGYILKPVTLAAFVEIMATLNKYWTVSELP
jgi:hypothetical protein